MAVEYSIAPLLAGYSKRCAAKSCTQSAAFLIVYPAAPLSRPGLAARRRACESHARRFAQRHGIPFPPDDEFRERHWAIVNQLLEVVTADEAYRMGLVTTLSLVAHVEASRELYQGACACHSTAEVGHWFDEFQKQYQRNPPAPNQPAAAADGGNKQKEES